MGAVICFVVNRLIYTHFHNRRFAVQNAARSNYISKGSIPFLTSNVYKYFPLAFFEIVNKIIRFTKAVNFTSHVYRLLYGCCQETEIRF